MTDELIDWILDREIKWDEPTIAWPNGQWRATFKATEAQMEKIVADVDDRLSRDESYFEPTDEGIVSHWTNILLKWRPRAHPKVAVPGAKRGRPRDKDNEIRRYQADPLLRGLSRATLYRWAARKRENERKPEGET